MSIQKCMRRGTIQDTAVNTVNLLRQQENITETEQVRNKQLIGILLCACKKKNRFPQAFQMPYCLPTQAQTSEDGSFPNKPCQLCTCTHMRLGFKALINNYYFL